jgi:hypothetical protein
MNEGTAGSDSDQARPAPGTDEDAGAPPVDAPGSVETDTSATDTPSSDAPPVAPSDVAAPEPGAVGWETGVQWAAVDASASPPASPPRKIDIGSVLRRALGMFVDHPLVFVVLALPTAVLGAILGGFSTGKTDLTLIPVALVVIIVGLVSGMASVIAADELRAGRKVRLDAVIRRAVGRVIPVILSALAQYLVFVGLGIVAVIIGVILVLTKVVPLVVVGLLAMAGVLVYVLLRWSLSFTAIALEGTGPVEALGRSRELTKGSLWRIFAVYLALGVITLPLPFAVGLLSVGSAPSVVSLLLLALAGLVSGPLFAIASMTIFTDRAGGLESAPVTASGLRAGTLLAAGLIVVSIATVAVAIPNLGPALDRASFANVPAADRGVIRTGTSRDADLCHPLGTQTTFSTFDSIYIGGYFTRTVPAGGVATVDVYANGTLANSGHVGDPTRATNCYAEQRPIVGGAPGVYRLVVTYAGETIAEGTFTIQ